MDCQARWWFKHGLQYPDPSNGKLALGRAVHTALGHNFAQKVDTYEDLPTLGVVALFREAWAHERATTEFRDEEDPVELAACGEALVCKYMNEVAPRIEPAAVEIRVLGEISGVKVQGWIDVLDVHGRIIEIKTAARRPSAVEALHRFQVATYVQLTSGATGEARIDTLVKTKSPALVTQSFRVDQADIAATRELYPLAQRSMRSAAYMPNRTSLNCSRRNCSFWRNCEREWGGEVPNT
jgi:CRISPR/Cas system-associated exonuclease Cas4 (RecB family)